MEHLDHPLTTPLSWKERPLKAQVALLGRRLFGQTKSWSNEKMSLIKVTILFLKIFLSGMFH